MINIQIPNSDKPRVVVVGGGFGGIQLVRKLAGKNFQTVLIDKHNYHTFQPLLYQVATAGLEPDSIAGPLRKQVGANRNFYFRMAWVEEIRVNENKLITSVGEISYDYLVLATGSKTNYFGIKSIEENAFPLKQITDALNLRSHILQNLEKAVITEDEDDLERMMNLVVVGGGPTGVEVAGALAELKRHVLPKDYPELDFSKMEIHLVEALPNLLNGMSDKSAKDALKALRRFAVKTNLEKTVTDFDGKRVTFSDGTEILTGTLIWAAGVKACIPNGIDDNKILNGRIIVDQYNKVDEFDNVFAVGDLAIMQTQKYPKGHPMMAPVAIQQAQLLAKNLNKLITNKKMTPFRYHHPGSMATIGRNRAVADFSKLHFKGIIAWFLWMFVHLVQIIGIRNKLVIFSNWAWNYFTYDRGTRLIIRTFKPKWEKE